MEDKKVTVTLNLMQSIVNYLDTRPYKEVVALIQEIVKQCNEPKPEEVLNDGSNE